MDVAKVVKGCIERLEDIEDGPANVIDDSAVVEAGKKDEGDAEPAALLLVIIGITKTVELTTMTESDTEVVPVVRGEG